MNRTDHWQHVYTTKPDDQVSWTQDLPALSLALIREFAPGGSVIDVGGGASRLAEGLLDAGHRTVAVLDISAAPLERARDWMGAAADRVRWIVADITACPDLGSYDVWHDRAVFHFLTERADRERYSAAIRRTVPVGGYVLISTFAPDGPTQCSGLEVRRYDAGTLAAELGAGFGPVKSVHETHLTPWGKPQAFQYSVFRRL
jgi:SAM-dependent methyltransferase